tara:strand:+ start:9028 stop:9642 length:615 start_codon:yes stop_codon:yes gene_type:complete
MLTVQTIKNSFTRFKRDISDVEDSVFIEWCDWMNKQAYNFIVGIDPERYISDQTYTISNAPQTEAFPSDFQSIDYLGCGLYEVDNSGQDTAFALTRTGFGRMDVGYYISGGDIVFTGISDSKQYKLRYIPALTTFNALTDTTVLDDRYLQHAVGDIDVLYSQWDVDPSAESLADFRFVRLLRELGDTVSRDVTAYQIDDFTQNF